MEDFGVAVRSESVFIVICSRSLPEIKSSPELCSPKILSRGKEIRKAARRSVEKTKLGISIPNTVTTNGIGAELGRVYAVTSANNYENSNAGAAAGPDGPSADTSSTVSKSSYGVVDAEGPNASANTYSTASGSTSANAAAGPNGAVSNGYAKGYTYSGASGTTTGS
ncbi:hypothetical protein HA466_0020260 [Hirschfeldia incana]|nr:hypothetical protein HA466_0020260 [Hirschfeldia incana]